MKRNHKNTGFCFFWTGVFVCLCASLGGQITSQTNDYSQGILYPVSPGPDSLFVFYSPVSMNKKGSLTAAPVQPGNYNFTWYRYNQQTAGFDPAFKNEINVTQSTALNLEAGGYKVRLWNGARDTTYMAWIYIDRFDVNVLKNAEGKVMPSQYTCDFITLNGQIDSDQFTYYDTATNASVNLPRTYTFLWTSDNPDLIIPWPDTSLVSNRSFNPPFIDTWYYLTGMDSYGMKDKDSVFYESIVPKPEFSFQYYDKEEVKDFVDPSGRVEESAPLRVIFKNESINGSQYKWIFSDKERSGINADETTLDLNYQPEYSYNIPEDYYPALIVTSEEGCIDSIRVNDPITIKQSALEVMNVFSPDGDSYNDYFKVRHQSIREFLISIYNRSGRLVYKAKINDLFSWDGWDGKVLNTGRPASPGAYYYIIEATGWDNKEYQKGKYAGVVYLFREGE